MADIYDELMRVFEGDLSEQDIADFNAQVAQIGAVSAPSETCAASTNAHQSQVSSATTNEEQLRAQQAFIERSIIRAPFTDESLTQYEHDADLLNAQIHNPAFGEILPTTFGLTGLMSGVKFNEERFIVHIRAHIMYPCVRVICNYGDARSANYDQLVRDGKISLESEKKAARARAKKLARRLKARKVQGNGCCFNSSMLVWLYSERYNAVYKVLLFRTGNFNLPGTLPGRIRDVITLLDGTLIPLLHRAQIDAEMGDEMAASASAAEHPRPQIEYLLPIMKNYKWERTLAPTQLIDLNALHTKLSAIVQSLEQEAPNDDAVLNPAMLRAFTIGQTYHEMCDPKISIRCNLVQFPQKRVRVKIFAHGRINILGARDTEITQKICEFITRLITDDLIISEDHDSRIFAPITYFGEYTGPMRAPIDVSESRLPHIALFH